MSIMAKHQGRFGSQPQKGAALFTVVILFLLILPLLMVTFARHTFSNQQMSASSFWQEQSETAAKAELANLRTQIEQSMANGLLEANASPPSWYVNTGDVSVAAQVKTNSSSFWTRCEASGLCHAASIKLNNGTGRQDFAIKELVTPTGIANSTACGVDGFTAVYYNIFINAQASTNTASGGTTIQSIYRACIKT